ncbi:MULTISPECIES: 2-hydroxyacyl-CoA dehydratase [Bacillus]|uniref:2-hydroxyacyl-CoA dehydratase n=1 Tax=Bacillus glycinifermentans TaxID=1664069 RepID=A0A0T6BN82_9BACI|nr:MULTISPECIES: 2-hydroxyacyl-CoA dehydratase [Bacillus]KRT93091.1 hypothetical protein AB447_203925 [Bacillus glycinifermentans]MEC0341928.1 2-hydroxyacyl-CoA dehydratase [Bacillus sonorensis]MEC0457386.1 2-hydroxyacyl-CoA dehydratase [Bacillus sonorensis]MEC0487902.1 2-hydroxyacyl-CoA dehydratase [Bacillus glycinifermentans]MEC0530647.1 2-hydroxyacyl-CoA dehydratase [Bacillus sonorensis]
MNNESVSVKSLIFHAHVQKLKELLSKQLDKTITESEFKELVKLTDECIKMMENVFEETNNFLLGSNLIKEEEAKELSEMLEKVKKRRRKYN